MLISYLLIILFIASFSIDDYRYFPDNKTEYNIDQNFYSSIRPEDAYIELVDIPSPIIKGDFIPLFIRYDVQDNDFIKEVCPDLEPAKKRLKSVIKFSKGDSGIYLHVKTPPEIFESHPDKILECLSSFYEIYINDSLYADLSYYFQTHSNKKEHGIVTMLDVSSLNRGKNEIKVFKRSDEKEIATIHFWLDK